MALLAQPVRLWLRSGRLSGMRGNLLQASMSTMSGVRGAMNGRVFITRDCITSQHQHRSSSFVDYNRPSHAAARPCCGIFIFRMEEGYAYT